jgi:membrane fusion protein (multidrug efflux system)
MSTLSYASEQKAKTGLHPSRQAIRRAALAFAVALGVAAAADFGHYYLTTGRYLETTDDAYVKADSTIIAPKVSGYIAEVLVADNEPVKAGQLLAWIDDRDFRTALNQAKADVAASEAAVKNLNAQIELQEPLIQQQAAEVDATEANLKFAQEERARYDGLMKSGSGTVQRAQQTDAALRSQTAQLQQERGNILKLRIRVRHSIVGRIDNDGACNFSFGIFVG